MPCLAAMWVEIGWVERQKNDDDDNEIECCILYILCTFVCDRRRRAFKYEKEVIDRSQLRRAIMTFWGSN